MQWVDPANWQEDDRAAELLDINALADHFSVTLGATGYDHTPEWKDLCLTANHYYSKLKCGALWKTNFQHRLKH